MNAWDRIVRGPHGIHILTKSMMGETASHLRDDHGITPSQIDKRENARLHLVAHGRMTEDGTEVG